VRLRMKQCATPSCVSSNDISVSLADGDAHAAVAEAEQLPMMSSRRVIRVTDFGKH